MKEIATAAPPAPARVESARASGSMTSALASLLGTRTLLLGGVMVVITSLFMTAEQDPDFWWHIRIGQWMVENGRLPAHDIFTFTVPDHIWTDHEYLTEILMWLVYSSAGLAGISIAFGLVTWFGWWFIYRRASRAPFVIVGLGLALGAIAGNPIWGPRAQMITFALSCLELYWIQTYLSGRSRSLSFFPLVMVAWANLHGGWVIAFVWLGVAIGAELIGWLWDRENAAHLKHVRFLAIITVASAVAILATPNGVSLLTYPFNTVGSVAQERLIVEWFSPDFHQRYLLPFEAMILIAIGGFALRRPTLYDFLLTVTAIALALQSVRNIALFVAAVTPVIINTYGGYWTELAKVRGWRLTSPVRPAFAVVTAVALVVIAGATTIHIAGDINPTEQTSLIDANYPAGAAAWLAANPGTCTRMFNQYGWGGYLAYRFFPNANRKVFIFGEAELMGDALLNEYADVQFVQADWSRVLGKYGVDCVVYNRDLPLTNLLANDQGWNLVYEDSQSVIFSKAAKP
jgi:hypothetical protein